MNYKNIEKKKFQKIDMLLARWQNELTCPSKNNKELAEEGILGLYGKYGKEKNPLILWCDSPVQVTVIPLLMANILKSEQWEKLVKRLNRPGTLQDDIRTKKWQSEWIRLEKVMLLPLFDRIWNFQFPHVGPAVQQQVLDRLNEHMYTLLVEGKTTYSSVFGSKDSKSKADFWYAPVSLDLWKSRSIVGAKIQEKTTMEFELNETNIQGLVVGAIDHRIITNHIPIAKDLLKPNRVDELNQEKIETVKAKLEELERIFTRRAAWINQAATGFWRNPEIPDIDEKVLEQEWYKLAWQGINYVKDEIDERLKEPRAAVTSTWRSQLNWLPLALSCRIIIPELLEEYNDDIDNWSYLFHGAEGYSMFQSVCIVCSKPKRLVTNESGNPHNSSGPAAVWSDGFEAFSWRGVIIDRELIEQPQSINVARIVNEKNQTIRQVLLEMFGQDRFIEESGAHVVDRYKGGVLYRYDFDFSEPLVMVKVKNSTPEPDGTYKYYYLRVPPDMQTAKQAVAWTFGLTSSEYEPKVES